LGAGPRPVDVDRARAIECSEETRLALPLGGLAREEDGLLLEHQGLGASLADRVVRDGEAETLDHPMDVASSVLGQRPGQLAGVAIA
jgi:hypothetical protein